MPNVSKNPSKEELAGIIAQSRHTAAKWLKDSSNGDIYYWPAELYQHTYIAAYFGIEDYTEGLVVDE